MGFNFVPLKLDCISCFLHSYLFSCRLNSFRGVKKSERCKLHFELLLTWDFNNLFSFLAENLIANTVSSCRDGFSLCLLNILVENLILVYEHFLYLRCNGSFQSSLSRLFFSNSKGSYLSPRSNPH